MPVRGEVTLRLASLCADGERSIDELERFRVEEAVTANEVRAYGNLALARALKAERFDVAEWLCNTFALDDDALDIWNGRSLVDFSHAALCWAARRFQQAPPCIPHRIAAHCRDLERQHDIVILFAVENGSRAWGMESADSDYDVRFVFVYRDLATYFRVQPPKLVVSAAFDEDGNPLSTAQGALIDMSGFDVTKYAKLLGASNPTAIEWTLSPVLYCGREETRSLFRDYAAKHFVSISLYWHYKSMSRKHREKFIAGCEAVAPKKYMYALRGAANALWVAAQNSLPPILFEEAYRRQLPRAVSDELDAVIAAKKQGREAVKEERIPVFDDWLEGFLADDSGAPAKTRVSEEGKKMLDAIVAEIVCAHSAFA